MSRTIRHHCGKISRPLMTRAGVPPLHYCASCFQAFRIAPEIEKDAHVTIARSTPPPAPIVQCGTTDSAHAGSR